MLIMGLENEYDEALRFVEQIDFTKSNTPAKGFETNIRYLGGLLAANDLDENPMLVQKATELTDNVLMPLFEYSPTKAPLTYMDLERYAYTYYAYCDKEGMMLTVWFGVAS